MVDFGGTWLLRMTSSDCLKVQGTPRHELGKANSELSSQLSTCTRATKGVLVDKFQGVQQVFVNPMHLYYRASLITIHRWT